ncbi:MAG TPA: hypothetical protein VFK05_30080 [Polyangiaceae bacterium]|nr:hypothetical protein [Polyangiaceae bacterium]
MRGNIWEALMNQKVSSVLLACLLGVGSLGSVGCASMRAAGAKHHYIESQTESHVYDKPLNAVWPEARQLLFAKGYSVKDTDASAAETEWKTTSDSFRNRLLLTGMPVDERTCKVQIMKEEQQRMDGKWSTGSTERDLGLEWELLRKVSPDNAQKIEQEAEVEGQKAAAAK